MKIHQACMVREYHEVFFVCQGGKGCLLDNHHIKKNLDTEFEPCDLCKVKFDYEIKLEGRYSYPVRVKVCEFCGQDFGPANSNFLNQKFCSDSCYHASRKKGEI